VQLPLFQGYALARIIAGPLAGGEVIVVRRKRDLQIDFPIELMRGSISVEVDAAAVGSRSSKEPGTSMV